MDNQPQSAVMRVLNDQSVAGCRVQVDSEMGTTLAGKAEGFDMVYYPSEN